MVPVYYENRPRRSKLFVAAVVLLWIALILLIVGFVTPGWFLLDYDFLPGERVIHTGLWYAVGCISGSCETASLVDNGVLDANMLEYRIETCLSLAAAIVAAVLASWTCTSIKVETSSILRNVAGSLCFISGILALVASGKYGDAQRDVHEILDRINISPISFPYSLFIFGFGGILIIIAAVLFFVSVCMNRQHRDSPNWGREMPPAQHGRGYQYPMKERYPEPMPYRGGRPYTEFPTRKPEPPAPVHYPPSQRTYDTGYDYIESSNASRYSRDYDAYSGSQPYVVSIGSHPY